VILDLVEGDGGDDLMADLLQRGRWSDATAMVAMMLSSGGVVARSERGGKIC